MGVENRRRGRNPEGGKIREIKEAKLEDHKDMKALREFMKEWEKAENTELEKAKAPDIKPDIEPSGRKKNPGSLEQLHFSEGSQSHSPEPSQAQSNNQDPQTSGPDYFENLSFAERVLAIDALLSKHGGGEKDPGSLKQLHFSESLQSHSSEPSQTQFNNQGPQTSDRKDALDYMRKLMEKLDAEEPQDELETKPEKPYSNGDFGDDEEYIPKGFCQYSNEDILERINTLFGEPESNQDNSQDNKSDLVSEIHKKQGKCQKLKGTINELENSKDR